MNKLLIFFSVVFLCGCSDFYDEDKMAITQKHIIVTIEDLYQLGFGGEIQINSTIQCGEKLNILQQGHCYVIDSYVVPDTSSFKTISPKLVYEPYRLISSINCQNTDEFIIVRAYIIFADSIIYSQERRLYLNQNGS